ncbi:MAG TPA: bifunctional nicotinamidase/pyrazinamidase [Terriglobia bacterium]|nr:bifunctional nicotinamidase/pyrazinamidase [Terriglobia bacterium]
MPKALLLIDIQNDFVPGGALAVPRGHEVVAVANRWIERFVNEGGIVVATQDWHPSDHVSFASGNPGKTPGDLIDLDGLPQVVWPDHCVQGTKGAAFVDGLNVDAIHSVVRKGSDSRLDSYSGFFDNHHRKQTELAGVLRQAGVEELYILGLATDYCVKFTALDARELGFPVTLVLDGCRAINVQPDDEQKAIEEMKRAGVKVTTSAEAL